MTELRRTSSDGGVPPDGAPSKPGRSLRWPRSRRLTASRCFRETWDQGEKFVGALMVLWLRRGPDAGLRLGIVASRKVGNAVKRNRARRRLREAWRTNQWRFSGPVDVILVARPKLLASSWERLLDELLQLGRRAGICGSGEEEAPKQVKP